MGFFDWLKKKRKEGEETRREELAYLGYYVGTSDELKDRVKEREKFYKDLSEFRVATESEDAKEEIKNMGEKLDEIDRLLKRVSVPWGRGGTESWYGKAMLGWEGLISKARTYISVCHRLASDSERKLVAKKDLAHKLRSFLVVEVLKYASWIEDVSWFGSDVTSKFTIVLQQPQAVPYGRGPTPQPGSLPFPVIKKDED